MSGRRVRRIVVAAVLAVCIGLAGGVATAVEPPPGSPHNPLWPGAVTQGMLTFRGNPLRTGQGLGPVPTAPRVLWRYAPGRGLCSRSRDQGVTKVWCGVGWTGQPNVWERPDGRTWLLFGAFDAGFHVLDAATGQPVKPRLGVGDLAKGSPTLDPDGFPLWYTGARDNKLRVIALDRDRLEVLWSLDARSVGPRLWNDDWDGSPMVWNDFLVAGGENGRLHIVKLNRSFAPDGRVQVAPQLVFHAAGWDAQLLRDARDKVMSIESSVMIRDDLAWFANSGGLVQAWDLRPLLSGGVPQRVFRFWTGDDTDATIVPVGATDVLVSTQYQRRNARGRQVGQFVRLDPTRPDPVVWSVREMTGRRFQTANGIWATPAVVGDVAITATSSDKVMGVDLATGAVLWTLRLRGPLITSPLAVDGALVVADCLGNVHGFSMPDPRLQPVPMWSVPTGGCIEATPTLWRGRIYIGHRQGVMLAIGDG